MFSLLSSIAITNIIYLAIGEFFEKKNTSNLKNFSEKTIIGFIYFSLLSLIINFFAPLSVVTNSIIIFIIFLIFLFKKKKLKKIDIFFLILSIFFCFFIIIFDTIFRPDAGLYHLPFVKILNEEKIIFGLANLHFRSAHVSIIQYSSAINYNFFLGDIGILIPLVSIYCFLTFYFLGDVFNFLQDKNKKNINYLSVLFSSLILIYISYKVNRYGEFGNDAIGHLLFFYLISKLINCEKFDYLSFNRIYLISVFAILNKFALLFSILIPVYIFFKKKISFRVATLSIPTLLLCLWILRSVIVSGCIVYPQINTCFTDLEWSNKKSIIQIGEVSEAWAKDWPNRTIKNISMAEYNKNFNWLETWYNNHFKKIIKILIPYLVLLLFIYIYFKSKIKKKYSFNINSYNFYLPLLVSLIGSIFFFLKFPIYRYGYSYLISLFILCFIFLIRSYNFEKVKKLAYFAICVFFISFIFKQTDRYIKFYKMRDFVPQIYNTKKQHETIKVNEFSFYNLSLIGSCKYDVNLCTPYRNDKLKINNKFSYKFFVSE